MRLNLSESERAALLKRRRLMRQLGVEQKAMAAARQRRSDRMRALNASITAGQRSERSLKGWETRRQEARWIAAAEASYKARLAQRPRDEEEAIATRAVNTFMLRSALARDPSRCYWGA